LNKFESGFNPRRRTLCCSGPPVNQCCRPALWLWDTHQPPSLSPVLPAARHGRAMPPMTADRGLMPAAKLSRAAPEGHSLFPIFPSMRRRTPGPPAPFFLSAHAIRPLKRSRRSLTSPPSPHFLLHPFCTLLPPSSPTEPVRAIPRSPHRLTTRRPSHPGIESPPPQ
jgi:hypothetical protein